MITDPGAGDEPAGDDEFVDRRTGSDRRRGGERRRGGRRHRRLGIPADRRSGKDRRQGTRRVVKDRRRVVDPRYKKRRRKAAGSLYSAEDVAAVQRLLSQVGGRVTCPVCDGPFALGPVDRQPGQTVRPVWCANCGRGTVVRNCLLARVMVLTRVEPLLLMLRGIFTGAGHEVVEPANTGVALDLYRENPADVVLLDTFALSQMDGQDFIRRLRLEFADPRIIVLAPRASYRTADPSVAAEQLGASRVVRMPFTREDMLRALKEVRPL
jgi:CheY-like chemotaxis protein